MTMGGSNVLDVVREVQVPLLAALLLGAVAAKARRAISRRSIAAGIGPTAMFPVHLQRPIGMGVCASELALGVGLLLTAGSIGAGMPADVLRSATALLFGTAVAALHELRTRQPDAGCGCFGDLSETPVSWRALARSALLCAAAVATIGEPPLRRPASADQAGLVLAVLAVELLVLAVLSPEIGELMVRLGYSEPCEVRRIPVQRTLAALRSSAYWRKNRRYIVDTEPTDVWREGCWRYVVFPAMVASRRVEVVFAVYLKSRRPPVRAVIYDATADKRTRQAASGVAGAAAIIPAPRRRPVPGPSVPAPSITVSGRAPHGAPHHVQHHTAHRVPSRRNRHSAGL
jgi:hypothetical protein